jgi:hypothetical protein
MALPQPMSVLMPTMAVMMVVVVVVNLARRLGVARTRCFGTGRETGQQDE